MFIIQKTTIFDNWLLKLKDVRAKAKILKRLKYVSLGNLGDCKSVGGGVSELRIQYGPGYSLYFTKKGNELILLLVGGDKSSQKYDIKKAQKMVLEQEAVNEK